MKKMISVVTGAALFVACASLSLGVEQAVAAKKQAGEPGVIEIKTASATATVQAVDGAKRTVTLKMPDGKVKTLKAGEEVKNFDQIKAGDKVKMTYMEELAVYLSKAGAPPSAEVVSTVQLAPKGAKPGMIAADTVELTAKVTAVNARKHTVTLMGPEGKSKTMKVAKHVNLKEVKKGDDVTVRYTEALAILVEKP